MYPLLIVVHVILCISLIIVVLLQSAKGEGLAGAFGGGGLTGAVFGGRGAATFLSKATAYLAVAFMLTCIGLTLVTPGGGGGQESAILEEMQSTPTRLDELPLRPETAEQSQAVFPPPTDTTE